MVETATGLNAGAQMTTPQGRGRSAIARPVGPTWSLTCDRAGPRSRFEPSTRHPVLFGHRPIPTDAPPRWPQGIAMRVQAPQRRKPTDSYRRLACGLLASVNSKNPC